MKRSALQKKILSLSEKEVACKNGADIISDLPFKTRIINGKEVNYIPIRDIDNYKFGPLFTIKKHSRYQSFPIHCHDSIEINYMYSGSCHQIINGKEYELQTGQTLLLNLNTVHQVLPLKETDTLLNININQDFLISHFLMRFSIDSAVTRFLVSALTDSIRQDNFLLFRSEKSEHLKQYIEDLLCEWYDPSLVSQDISESLLSLIVLELVLSYKDTFTQEFTSNGATPVLPILRYIEENYLTCTLSETAKIFNLNQNYLSNLLKKHTGLSYRELVQQQKLSASEHLLQSSDLSISEIAHMSGYENVSFFYKKFVEKNGCNPNDYRKKHRIS